MAKRTPTPKRKPAAPKRHNAPEKMIAWSIYAANEDYLGLYTFTMKQVKECFPGAEIHRSSEAIYLA